MALKYQIDKLEDVAAPLREHYTAKDGKYQLTLDGEPSESAKVKEFRDSAIASKKALDELRSKFDGIDPEAVKADRAKLTEYESAKPNEKIAALQLQLDEANKRANGAVLKDAVGGAFLKAGGYPSALDFVLSKADGKFTVENGAIVGSVFDPTRPGEKLTVDGFIQQQLTESAFAFKPSSGSGAEMRRSGSGGGGNRTGAKELRNPTPQQLGAAGPDIRAGKVKVVYDHE